MNTDSLWPRFIARLTIAVVWMGVATFALPGCERKERVLDVQTPGADIEVDRNLDTGEIEADVEEN